MKDFMSRMFLCLLIPITIVGTAFSQDINTTTNNESQHTTELSPIKIGTLPIELPGKMTIPINYKGEVLSMALHKTSIFGKHTRCLIDDGTGQLTEIAMGEERNYLGTIVEKKDHTVSAVMTDKGLMATITRPDGTVLEIAPTGTDNATYSIKESDDTYECGHKSPPTVSIDTQQLNTMSAKSENLPQPSEGPVFSGLYLPTEVSELELAASARPTKVMEVLEFELAVEIGSRSFFSRTAYDGNLSKAQTSARSIIGNLNSRFLSSAGVRFKLGTLIIRTNASTDPLRDLVTSTGAATNATKSLEAFRDYWNNNPSIVGNTHDLAVYHVASRPSGLAWVGAVGERNRYATLGGNGATSWANGTAAHEVGHSFGLKHVNHSKYFYEARPRNNSGTDSKGGRNYFISIMHGSGNHNIGRMSSDEAKIVTQIAKSKKSVADKITNAPNINPFGVYDEVEMAASQSSILIDVIANDYDANNDVLDVKLLDKTGFQGGTISLSQGTGPGGRNQIRYSPPSSGLSSRDFFHYTVVDSKGKTDFGAVYVSQAPGLPANFTEVTFDFGTESSPLFPNTLRVSNKTTGGDFGWTNTSGLNAADRGAATSVNNLNRDFIYSSQAKTFETKVSNGEWEALITFGDKNFPHDNMQVKAEGVLKVTNATTSAGQFLNQELTTEVRDGKISLQFLDNGGSDPNWTVTRLRLKKLRNPPSTQPGLIGSVISLRGNNNRYISSENGSKPINCNREKTFVWERFTVVNAGGDKVALKGSNGKYVSSENGAGPMTCNRTAIGNWEKFSVIDLGADQIALKGSNNLYVSSENGTNPMNCNRNRIGAQERFNVGIISSRAASAKVSVGDNISDMALIYPNPATDLLIIDNIEEGDQIFLLDNMGRLLTTTRAAADTQEIDIKQLKSGMYLIQINNDTPQKLLKK